VESRFKTAYIIMIPLLTISISKLEVYILLVNLSFYHCSMIQWMAKHI